MEKASVSVIILTYNEEVNIKPCLESAKDLTDEIFIVDSFSTDKTLDIARESTDKIYQNAWVHWAHQRNWALANLPISHDWVFFLDADEYFTPELREEIAFTLASPNQSFDGYLVKREFYFLGRWLKHGGYNKDFILRFFKKDKAQSIGRGAREYVTIQGQVGRLKSSMLHEDHKDLGAWIQRQNGKATLEAQEILDKRSLLSESDLFRDRKVEHSSRIMLHEKIWPRLPLLIRPFIKFCYHYILRLGILDGKEGFIYWFLMGLWYPLLVDAKYLELIKIKKSS